MKHSQKKGTGVMFIIVVVFTFCGVLMLYGAIRDAVSHVRFFKNAIEITGIISQIDITKDSEGEKHYTAYVSYIIDNILYEDIPLPYYTSGMYEGDAITLYYNIEKPKHVQTKTGSMFEIIVFTVMGLVFTALGIGFMVPIIRRKKQKRLKKTGQCIRIPITRIEVNESIRVNGVPAHYIICEETDLITGRKFIYQSSNYYSYLDNTMQTGDIVPVYIDPNNSENYYIDVENVEPGNFTEPELTN